MVKKIIIGSRGSKLALLYAQKAKEQIIKKTTFAKNDIEIKPISTKGDQVKDTRLSDIGGKGLFSTEIEKELKIVAEYDDQLQMIDKYFTKKDPFKS